MKPNQSLADLRSKAEARLRTYKALAQLYEIETGTPIPESLINYPQNCEIDWSGEILYFRLLELEAKAHKLAEDMCCIEVPEEIAEKTYALIEASVLSLFRGSLTGFFINTDPRGYSLKISSERTQDLAEKGIPLERDWGGYGILAPDHR